MLKALLTLLKISDLLDKKTLWVFLNLLLHSVFVQNMSYLVTYLGGNIILYDSKILQNKYAHLYPRQNNDIYP